MCFSSKFIKNYLFLFFLIIPFVIVFSQNDTITSQSAIENNRRFKDNVRFGGGIGLGFGDGFFNAALSPTAVYDVNNLLSLGLGYNLAINNRRDLYTSVINGGRVIGLLNPIPQLQASTEYEQNYVTINYKNSANLNNRKYWSPALFLGLGYNTGSVTFGMRYDLLYREDRSIYASPFAPFIRVFF